MWFTFFFFCVRNLIHFIRGGINYKIWSIFEYTSVSRYREKHDCRTDVALLGCEYTWGESRLVGKQLPIPTLRPHHSEILVVYYSTQWYPVDQLSPSRVAEVLTVTFGLFLLFFSPFSFLFSISSFFILLHLLLPISFVGCPLMLWVHYWHTIGFLLGNLLLFLYFFYLFF